MTKEKYSELTDVFEGEIDRHVEYETTNQDAGDAYSHLAREGGWAYTNGLDRLKQWMSENKIDVPNGFDWDDLEDEVLDWHEMEAGHVFSGGSDSNRFVIDSYAVGEVEDQFCIADLARLLDISDVEAREFAKLAMNDNRFCLKDNYGDGVLSYTNTDAVWIAYVSKEWVIERVEWQREALEEEAVCAL